MIVLLQPDACVPLRFDVTNDPDATTQVDENTAVYVEFGYDPDNWLLTDAVDGKPLSRTIMIAGPDAPTPGTTTVLAANTTVRFAIGSTTDGPPRPTGTIGSIRIATP